MTEEFNVMVNSEELIGNTEYLTLCTRCRINLCHYNRVRLYMQRYVFVWDVGRFKSDGCSKKMVLDEIMYPTSLCEGTVSNVNCILIVFLLKQTGFVYS